MSGYIDLHCHYLPAIDDGVRTLADGVALVRGLRDLGYSTVVATPHIRTAMFENRKPGLESTFQSFVDQTRTVDELPQLGLGAEHYFDDVFWELFERKEIVPYPGGHAALVEFPTRAIPRGVEHRLFDMNVRGIRPVLAHPERYEPLFKKTDPLRPLLEIGVLPLLDTMSLDGKYGRRPKKAAERMLSEGVYFAACSDCHRPSDVEVLSKSIRRLKKLVGNEEAGTLLGDHPGRILDGRLDS